MVQQGDFSLQLVESASKMPFPEHHHDGKTYAEVEPNVEYFIAMSKPRAQSNASGHIMITQLLVDGTPLNYGLSCSADKLQPIPRYLGLLQYEHGVSTHVGLKFVTPQVDLAPSAQTAAAGIGHVQVHIYEGFHLRPVSLPTCVVPMDLTAAPTCGAHKKPVRSATGTCVVPAALMASGGTKGRLLYTLTLYYCTTPGLVHMGVLPAPQPDAKGNVTHASDKKRHLRPEGLDSETMDALSSHDETLVDLKPKPKAMATTIDLTGCDNDSDSD